MSFTPLSYLTTVIYPGISRISLSRHKVSNLIVPHSFSLGNSEAMRRSLSYSFQATGMIKKATREVLMVNLTVLALRSHTRMEVTHNLRKMMMMLAMPVKMRFKV